MSYFAITDEQQTRIPKLKIHRDGKTDGLNYAAKLSEKIFIQDFFLSMDE